MHPRAFSTAYSSLIRHHEQLTRAPQSAHPTLYHHNVSSVQTLASLRDKAQRLRENERSLQKQIDYYQASLKKVQAALNTTVNKANELQNFLAPISMLPNEILLAIFEEAGACQDQGIAQRAEFIISKVSRRWRELAIHSPRLWRRVCITPRVAPGMLEMYKSRASRALDIEIWGWRDRRDFQRFDTALETVLDSFSRWRSLSIVCVCDTHLSHLTLKLSHIGNISGLKHFTFRALRPGQTCSVSFLMEAATSAQPSTTCQTPSPCTLKSLDAENFTMTGDLASIHARAVQSFSRLSSLTLRRYSQDTRSSRTMIDFSAFRAMLSGIPYLTILVLYGQPLRFHTDPVSSLQSQHGITHGSGIGAALGVAVSTATISLPQLHTLVLHPRALKPRYLQQTISAIHAPALRHFELVFPDSKFSGQSVIEQLFVDALPPFCTLPSSSAATSYGSYPSSTSATEHTSRRRPRFPHVETLVLHNASTAGTALAFIHAFPCTTQATLGGVDIGFFPQVLRSGAASVVDTGTSLGRGRGSKSGMAAGSASGSGISACDCNFARFAHWHRLHTLTLRQPGLESFRVLLQWIRSEYQQRHSIPTLIVEGSTDRSDIRPYLEYAQICTKVVVVETQSSVTALG